jgi:hypothetical protein
MKNDDFVAPICILMIAAACHIICNNQRGRRTWVRPWIQLRREVGAYHALINEGAGTGGSKRFQKCCENSTNLSLNKIWREILISSDMK